MVAARVLCASAELPCVGFQRRQRQAATLRNLPLRSIPAFVPAFMPGLSDILSLAPALHAVPSRHPFTWPWAAMGFGRAQPAACLAAVLLAAAMLAGSLSPTRRGPESSCSKSFWDLPLVEGPRRQVHPKTTTFCLVLGFTPSRQPSKTHQSQNDFEQLQSTTLSGRSSAKECQVALLFATATCRSALPECLMLFRKPCSKTFGERCALQGLPEGGGFTKRGKIGEFGDECAFYALLRGVLSPSDFEEGYHRSASRPSTGPSRTSTW